MYRNLRPGPLDMTVIPGRCRSRPKDKDAKAFIVLLPQGKCPVTLDRGANARQVTFDKESFLKLDSDAIACQGEEREPTLASISTTADCESVASSVGVTESSSPFFSEALPQIGSPAMLEETWRDEEPDSPLDSMLLKSRRRSATLRERGRGDATGPRATEACEPDAADHGAPSSPLDGALLRAKRRNAFVWGVRAFAA